MSTSPYKNSTLYDAKTISVSAEDINDGPSYAERLLYDRVMLVKRYARGTTLLDIGCATGETLRFFDEFTTKIGIDFSQRYLVEANNRSRNTPQKPYFITGDVTALPLIAETCDVMYSFSTLYYVKNFSETAKSIWLVLRPGGVAILDLGNIRSLNAICGHYYVKEDGYAEIECPDINTSLTILRNCGFEILEHRSFQLLPLWAAKPRWMWPLLHPIWAKIMKIRLGEKMIDEWLSSLPFLRNFAFRHILVCRKS